MSWLDRLGTALLVVPILVSCSSREPAPPADEVRPAASFEGAKMGTTWTVRLAEALDEGRTEEVRAAIDAELELVDAAMSTWREDSEVTAFNRHRDTTPFALSADTAAVLAEALRVGDVTGGAFDITVGPLVEAWGFGSVPADEPPSRQRLAELERATGLDKLRLNPGEATLTKRVPEVEIDLSGIAKGYAVDRVAEALETLGHARYMVEVGGEVRLAGRNAGNEPWRIGIERPDAARGRLQRILSLSDTAVATSGDYRNFRVVDGERLTHILDPRAGRPIHHRLASVTVLHPSCTTADALATGLMVLGPDDALALAEQRDLAVLLLVRDGHGGFEERWSAAFEDTMALSGPPAP
ncbi:MAG: FAD:protein FMN transferase [Thermoanaerobaculia bacterium]